LSTPGQPYLPHTSEEIEHICKTIGVGSVDELLEVFPEELRLTGALDLPAGLSEQEVLGLLTGLASKNTPQDRLSSFLGAGAYNHYIPAAIGNITARSEFITSYTPYQPEISQGTLQAIFEYQSLICQLTAMEVANASLYDGASATAEAVLMARRVTRRGKALVSAGLHPEYRETVATYLKGTADRPACISYGKGTGTALFEEVEQSFDDDTACLVVQCPNFFGGVEDIKALADLVHSKKGLLVVVISEALSMGALTPAGELGADIVVGEAQSFGSPLSYGGPYLGFMGVREKYLRQMPGRVVGQTVDRNERRSYCLTMATREQHIRREKATSNICTNQGLVALTCAIYLTLLGKGGLMRLARLNMAKAAFLKEELKKVAGIKIAFDAPNFNEFVIEIDGEPKVFLKALLEKGIAGGVELGRFYPELKNHILIAATEMNTRAEMEAYAETAAALVKA